MLVGTHMSGTFVQTLARTADEERRRLARLASQLTAAAATNATWTLPARMELGDFSMAEGPWEIQWDRAQADARATLATIDFSKPEIMMWVPGTDGVGVHRDFARGARTTYRGAAAKRLSLTALQYEASWHLRRSLPTGLATMKLVMEGIRQKFAQLRAAGKPVPKLLLGGLSQGAWIIGEVMADAKLAAAVTRVSLVGHPWLARHQYTDGHDPRVNVINHAGDQIAMPVKGSAGVGLDAMIAVRTGQLKQDLGTVARAILANPLHGVLLLQNQMRNVGGLRPFLTDPHDYDFEMARMVEYLRTGVMPKTNQELEALEKAGEQGA